MPPSHHRPYAQRTDDGGGTDGLQIQKRIGHQLLSHAFAINQDQRLVPDRSDLGRVETKVAPLHGEFCRETDDLISSVLDLFPTLQDERDRFGLAMHGEIASDFVSALDGFGARTLELDRGELLRVEVVGLT